MLRVASLEGAMLESQVSFASENVMSLAFLLCVLVLGFEPRASCMLGKCFTELHF